MTPSPPAADVLAALRDLGPDPDAVAATLRAAGVTGRRCSAYTCPVSNWLRRRFGVTGGGTDGYFAAAASTVYAHVHGTMVTTPAPVADFIREFDTPASRYADLTALPPDRRG